MSLMFMIKNDARSLARLVTMRLSQKIVVTPVNGRSSLFGIDSVQQMETFLPHALLVF
jgi:hypothetical protein